MRSTEEHTIRGAPLLSGYTPDHSHRTEHWKSVGQIKIANRARLVSNSVGKWREISKHDRQGTMSACAWPYQCNVDLFIFPNITAFLPDWQVSPADNMSCINTLHKVALLNRCDMWRTWGQGGKINPPADMNAYLLSLRLTCSATSIHRFTRTTLSFVPSH